MTKNKNLRFVHHQVDSRDYNGMTIAYTRTETNLFFSYALCAKTEQYEKSEGRRITTKTFMDNIDEIHHDVTYADITKRVGCVAIEDMCDVLRDSDAVTAIFADHVIDKITFMDLKHAMISEVVLGFAIDSIFGE